MNELRSVWKLLLKKEFYNKHKFTLPASSFDEIGKDLLPTLEEAHAKIASDLTEDELLLYHCALNPTVTTAQKNTYGAYLENIKGEPAVNPDVADKVYESLWRREVGRFIAEYGIRLEEGKHAEVDSLMDYVSKVGKSLVPQDFDEPVDTDPVALFDKLNARGKWKLNIPNLDRKVGNLSPGQFIILLARPEAGKTATIVNLMAGREGFAAQGAKVHLIANEEGADRTAGRCVSCFSQKSIAEIAQNPASARTPEWEALRKNLVLLHKPEISVSQLENYCKTNRPDVLIIDQLDHLSLSGTYEKNTDRVGAVYRKARELAAKYDMVVIGVSQASAEGENKSKITFSMAENSKTGKAATADLVIGVGKIDESTEEEGNCVLRHYHVSKNKLSGWHGTTIVQLIQNESRLIP